jgi:hypothetical protein
VDNLHEQLASLHSISAEIAGLHELAEIHDQALGCCLNLTHSEFAFTGLLRDAEDTGAASGRIKVSDQVMDVAAIRTGCRQPRPGCTQSQQRGMALSGSARRMFREAMPVLASVGYEGPGHGVKVRVRKPGSAQRA